MEIGKKETLKYSEVICRLHHKKVLYIKLGTPVLIKNKNNFY